MPAGWRSANIRAANLWQLAFCPYPPQTAFSYNRRNCGFELSSDDFVIQLAILCVDSKKLEGAKHYWLLNATY
jgi:hypothetical protein